MRKKDSVDGTVTVNGLPPTAAEHTLPAVDHALSVSSDSGNSTASIKTDRTDEVAAVHPAVNLPSVPTVEEVPQVHHQDQQAISPREKQELEQLLGGLEGPMHRQTYRASPTSAVGGILHRVPAQVHVNGHGAVDRETDILDDELPSSQKANSVDSLGTFSSTDGRATPADLYFQAESVINGQDHVAYLERSVAESPVETAQSQICFTDQHVTLTRNDSLPASNYLATPNLSRSLSLGSDLRSMPPAPTRTTSSRDAVQRGLNIWQRFGVPEEPVTEGLTFGTPPSAVSVPLHQSLPQFPHGHSTSQEEIEQSIETLNLLMLDLEPSRSFIPKSQSAPLRDTSVVTTQPSFSLSQSRAIYEVDTPPKPSTPEPAPVFGLQATGTGPSSSASATGQLRPQAVDTFRPSALSQSTEVLQHQRCAGAGATLPASGDDDPDEVFNVEGLVAQRVAGKNTNEYFSGASRPKCIFVQRQLAVRGTGVMSLTKTLLLNTDAKWRPFSALPNHRPLHFAHFLRTSSAFLFHRLLPFHSYVCPEYSTRAQWVTCGISSTCSHSILGLFSRPVATTSWSVAASFCPVHLRLSAFCLYGIAFVSQV